MKKVIIAFIVLFCGTVSVFSQTVSRKEIDVKGLILDKNYTDAQIRQALGVPTRFNRGDESDGPYQELVYDYNSIDGKKNDQFKFRSSGEFFSFYLVTSKYSLFGDKVKIDSFVGVFQTLGFGRFIVDGVGEARFYVNVDDDDYIVVLYDSLGKITALYSTSFL